VDWRWSLPAGWTATPASGHAGLGAGERARAAFALSIPADYVFRQAKQAIALEVSLDGRHLGQLTEAVVESAPFGAAGGLAGGA
jgi:hypothetical protein